MVEGRVDITDFERVIARYASVSGRTLEESQWRALDRWTRKAIVAHKAIAPASTSKSDIADKTGNYRVMVALRKARTLPLAGLAKGGLKRWMRQERARRNKSVGFARAMMLGIGKAARTRSDYISATGITAHATSTQLADRRVAALRAERDLQPLTAAARPHDLAGFDIRVADAYDMTRQAQIADMEQYIARKLGVGQ